MNFYSQEPLFPDRQRRAEEKGVIYEPVDTDIRPPG